MRIIFKQKTSQATPVECEIKCMRYSLSQRLRLISVTARNYSPTGGQWFLAVTEISYKDGAASKTFLWILQSLADCCCYIVFMEDADVFLQTRANSRPSGSETQKKVISAVNVFQKAQLELWRQTFPVSGLCHTCHSFTTASLFLIKVQPWWKNNVSVFDCAQVHDGITAKKSV